MVDATARSNVNSDRMTKTGGTWQAEYGEKQREGWDSILLYCYSTRVFLLKTGLVPVVTPAHL